MVLRVIGQIRFFSAITRAWREGRRFGSDAVAVFHLSLDGHALMLADIASLHPEHLRANHSQNGRGR